ncbi:LlaJI family restriction endonuclease [Streptococcus sanguinis]|uniref:LlaJI family restriction endonuclease n=1 Tax=Streptococcus sanguinis TaxID=1305 RepID=UPI001D14364D|nr:LlaJI family restriction endonuclease [Streptococcus sanguinis]MCC3172196.1 llaJI restriction endonuclease family protein [Streptococcus sanguinis]
MKTVYVREEKGYTFSELSILLGEDMSDAAIVCILKRLKRFNVIKKVKKSLIDNFDDLSEINDELVELVEVDSSETEVLYKFKFVGVVVVKSIIFYCYPKYISSNSRPFDEFKQVLKVIEKYSKKARTQNLDILNDISDESNFNELALNLFLLEDYFDYGLFSTDQSVIEINGSGDIIWDKTINDTYAFISDDTPIYPELYTRKSQNDDENIIRQLHEVVISTISKKMDDCDFLNLFDLSGEYLTDVELEDLGDSDYLLYSIEAALSKEFNTRKQLLLKALYSYVSEKYDADSENYISVYGTNSIHIIWETACKVVFDDKLYHKISNLGLAAPNDSNSSNQLIEIIEKPLWLSGNDEAYFASSTLIPDTITIRNDTLLILDGKYYSLKFANHLEHAPGVGDVTKQFLYELAYKEFANKNNLHVLNYFLMPTENSTDLHFGKVDMKMLSNLDLSQVRIAKLNAYDLYEKYLSDRIDEDLLGKLCESVTMAQ